MDTCFRPDIISYFCPVVITEFYSSSAASSMKDSQPSRQKESLLTQCFHYIQLFSIIILPYVELRSLQACFDHYAS